MRILSGLLLVILFSGPQPLKGGLFFAAVAPRPSLVLTNVVPNNSGGNNDNVVGGGSANTVLFELTAGDLTRNDLVLTRMDTGGTTEYFSTTTLTNNTGFAWNSFELQIGTGFFDGNTDTFVAQTMNNTVMPDYDFSDLDTMLTSDTFTVFEQDQYLIRFSGGTVAPGQMVTMGFPVDIPDGMPADITFRANITAVPEPQPLLLAGLALLAILAQRRRSMSRSDQCRRVRGR